jgi:hypothetical protein
MARTLVALFLLVSVCVSSLADGSGLVASLSFEEGSARRLLDASGCGQRAVVKTAPWVGGVHGLALSFADPAAAVRVASRRSLNLGAAITIEAWILPGPPSDLSRIIVAKNDEYLLRIDKQPEGGRISAFVQVGTPALNWEPRVSSLLPPTVGQWHHVAVTWDGTLLRMYLDGALQAETQHIGKSNPNPYPVMIGNFEYQSCHGGNFGGAIDEVRLYQRALAATEVRQRFSGR